MMQVNRWLAAGLGVMALGVGWTAYGVIQMNVTGDIFTDNTLGLGVVTMVMAFFILRRGRRGRSGSM